MLDESSDSQQKSLEEHWQEYQRLLRQQLMYYTAAAFSAGFTAGVLLT